MTGTITTRAGESQRAPGGLHPFFEGHGADSSTTSVPGVTQGEKKSRPLLIGRQLLPIGRQFLDRIFSHYEDDLVTTDGEFWRSSDPAWLAKRRDKLKPMTEGRMRVVSKVVWDLSDLLMHPVHRRATWKRFAKRVPSDFLAMATAVALLDSEGGMRALDSRRANAMMAAIVLLWLLAEPDPHGGQWGYVIRGLPYGTWCELLARFEDAGDTERVPPFETTVFGTHRVGGRYDKAENGYLAAFKQAGLIQTKQPPWWAVGAGMRGRPRVNKKGDWECWAFVEVRLRIPAPGADAADLGPPGTCFQMPPLEPPTVVPKDDVVTHSAPQWMFLDPEPQLSLPRPEPERRTAQSAGISRVVTAEAELPIDEDARAANELVRSLLRKPKPSKLDHVHVREVATSHAEDIERLEAHAQSSRTAYELVSQILHSKKPPKPG